MAWEPAAGNAMDDRFEMLTHKIQEHLEEMTDLYQQKKEECSLANAQLAASRLERERLETLVRSNPVPPQPEPAGPAPCLKGWYRLVTGQITTYNARLAVNNALRELQVSDAESRDRLGRTNNTFGAADALRDYEALRASAITPKSKLNACRDMRDEIVSRICCEAKKQDLAALDAWMVAHAGELWRRNDDFRSSFLKSHKELFADLHALFPSEKARPTSWPRAPRRRRANRGAAAAGPEPAAADPEAPAATPATATAATEETFQQAGPVASPRAPAPESGSSSSEPAVQQPPPSPTRKRATGDEKEPPLLAPDVPAYLVQLSSKDRCILKVKNTFLDVQEDRQSEDGKVSIKSWPRQNSKSDDYKQRPDEVHSESELESLDGRVSSASVLMQEVPSQVPKQDIKKVVRKLGQNLSDRNARAPERDAARLRGLCEGMPSSMHFQASDKQPLLAAARLHCEEPQVFSDILSALSAVSGVHFLKMIKDLASGMEPPAVANCATAAATAAQHCKINDIAAWLVETMASYHDSQEVQEAAVNSLLSLCRLREEVLTIPCSRQAKPADASFSQSLRDDIKSRVTQAIDLHEGCSEVGVRILARSQELPVLLELLARKSCCEDLLTAALSEMIYTLEEPMKAFDDQCNDAPFFDWGCNLLRSIASQRLSIASQHCFSATRWVNCSHYQGYRGHVTKYRRFILVALIFGSSSISDVFEHFSSGNYFEYLDQELLSATFRGLSYLNDHLEAMSMFRDEVVRVSNDIVATSSHSQLQRETLSTIVGALGSLMKGTAASQSKLCNEALNCIFTCCDRIWERNAAFDHEAMYALSSIFEGAASLGRWSRKVVRLASSVCNKWRDQKYPEWSDQVSAVCLAKQLLDRPRGQRGTRRAQAH